MEESSVLRKRNYERTKQTEGKIDIKKAKIGYPAPYCACKFRSRKISTPRNDQVHVGELHLVDWAFLCGESTDLIGRDNHIFALLFAHPRATAPWGIGAVDLGPCSAFPNYTSLGRVL